MSARDDGGPAFPTKSEGQCGPNTYRFPGMSLRDWFAGQALAGICGDGIPGAHHTAPNTARDAYEYADAMLAVRCTRAYAEERG